MGLSVAGVDILRSNHGPLVMEVNSSPGLEGIEVTTGKNVAGMIIEHLGKNGGPNLTRTKGKG
ncbi:Ribosomal protein S6 modification protein [compost metagenome]